MLIDGPKEKMVKRETSCQNGMIGDDTICQVVVDAIGTPKKCAMCKFRWLMGHDRDSIIILGIDEELVIQRNQECDGDVYQMHNVYYSY